MKRFMIVLCVVAVVGLASAARAAIFDITTLPGYGSVTNTLNFSDTGWGGWSAPAGKVVLRADIISAGDSVSDLSVFMPGAPGQTIGGYTFGVGEYGWRLHDVANGANNPGFQWTLHYADMPAGYTITTSSTLIYSGTGLGGWSAPFGNVVSGGGFRFSNDGASASVSQFLEYPSNYTGGYAYSPGEEGWGVQSAQVGGPANIYVVSFDAIPEPTTILVWSLLGLAAAGFGVWRRKRAA